MAWRTFYDAYFGRLWRYLLVAATGREEAAREALQGTMIRLTRHIKVFRDETVFWSWLTVLARSALSDETKRQRRYFAFLDRFMRQARVENDGGNNGQVENRLKTLLEKHVAMLPSDERQLIEQKYFARRSVRDIADGLATTERAVESRLSRVRRKLRNALLAALKDESH